MFTPANLKTLAFATNSGWYIGVVPYHFAKVSKKEDRQIHTSFSNRRAFYQVINLIVSTFYFVFLLLKLIEKVLEGEPPLAFLLRMSYYLCAYGTPVFMQITTVTNWREIPRFNIQYLAFFKRIQVTYSRPSSKSLKCMKFFSTVIFISFATTLQNTILMFKRPYLPNQITSLLPDPKGASTLTKLPILVLSLWIWLSTWINIWNMAFHFYMYMTCSIYLLAELDLNVKTPRTTQSLRQSKTCIKILRSMQVLHRLWGSCYEDFLCPMHKGAAITVAILGLYGVLKLTGISSIIMGFAALFCLLYLSTMFYKFGKFNDLSQKTLQNWQHSTKTTKYMRKLLKSIPDFRVRIAGYYYVKKVTILMVIWTVLNNTITLLML